MLMIRDEQMEVLSKYMLKQFEDRMVSHLKKNFANETRGTSDLVLRKTMRISIDKAAKYNVTDETDVKRYLEYVVRYGLDFDTNQNLIWATKILCEGNMTGTEKMNQLDDYEMFVLRLGHK